MSFGMVLSLFKVGKRKGEEKRKVSHSNFIFCESVVLPRTSPILANLDDRRWEMLSGEAGDVFALLEGGVGGARAACDAFVQLYSVVREPWLTRALLLYHARTGSARAIELLARAPDLHSRHLLDALQEQLQRGARQQALAALMPLVARRPPWLHRLPAHPLARDLVRTARNEREPLPLLHALLTLAALLPAAPALAVPHISDLTEVLLRPAALEPPPSPATRAHLQLAQLALFHALYATHPCTLLETLRADLTGAGARDAWERDVAPLLRSVRLHPGLVTGSRQREADAARWARLEPHDVVAECRRLSLQARSPGLGESPIPATPTPEAGHGAALAGAAPAGSPLHAARAAHALRPGADGWFPLAERAGADSAPATPLPNEPDGGEPPEAAIEATPENTPARDTRAIFRFPSDSATVRAIGRKETSPSGGEAYAARLARVAAERRAADSPVPVAFGGAPPACAARPEPRPAPAPPADPPGVEDREVTELTARAHHAERAWPDGDASATPRLRDPRAVRRARTSARGGPPPRRAASCCARLPPQRSRAVAVQTVDAWPAPYEFVIADYYRNLPDESKTHVNGEETCVPSLPCEKLDSYLHELYSGRSGSGNELAEQLALAHAQLMYERWRREAHAERNRRLLGRVRQVRALELQNAALKERLRAVTRERDELRARRPRSPAPAPRVHADRERELEAALAAERAARLRAEAFLKESEAQRALDVAELNRTRSESYEAARHVEALAKAALAAERRGEHVRRLRRELLVLAEREQRLAEAVRTAQRAPPPDVGTERTLRAALARAEAELDAVTLRAEAAALRSAELEAAAAARDAAVAELRRALRLAADDHAARLRALQDKYKCLMRTVRGVEAFKLELLADASGSAAQRAAAACAAASSGASGGASRGASGWASRGASDGALGVVLAAAAPTLADCERTRRLLEADAEDEAARS